jgi:hypothetical protein
MGNEKAGLVRRAPLAENVISRRRIAMQRRGVKLLMVETSEFLYEAFVPFY